VLIVGEVQHAAFLRSVECVRNRATAESSTNGARSPSTLETTHGTLLAVSRLRSAAVVRKTSDSASGSYVVGDEPCTTPTSCFH